MEPLAYNTSVYETQFEQLNTSDSLNETQFEQLNTSDSLNELRTLIADYKSSDASDVLLCDLNLRTFELYKKIRDETLRVSRELNTVVEDECLLRDTIIQLQQDSTTIIKLSAKYNDTADVFYSPSEHSFYKELLANTDKIHDRILERKRVHVSDINSLLPKAQALRKAIMTGIEELVDKDNANNKKLCPVCFDKEVDMAMIPCGHTCCAGCLNQTSSCMQCRSKIQSKVKLFFSA